MRNAKTVGIDLKPFIDSGIVRVQYNTPQEIEIDRHFHDIELPDGLTLVVTEKRVRRSQSGAEGRADLWRVGADDGQLTVVDRQVLL
jgi:hypothetical protein